MGKTTPKSIAFILAICLLLLPKLTGPVMAECDPPCPTCYRCEGNSCRLSGDCATSGHCGPCKGCWRCHCYLSSGSQCASSSDCGDPDNCISCIDCKCKDRCTVNPVCLMCNGEGSCVPECNWNDCEECADGECEDICTRDPNLCLECNGEGWCVNRCTRDPNLCLMCDGQGNCVSTCDPNLCQDCNEGTCEVCNGDPNKACCDGACCDPEQCCIDGECVDPICDSCHAVSDTLYECGHHPGDTDCATTWCIKNVLNSATCDYKGDGWPCKKSRCNTTAVSPHQDEITQYKINSGSCPGGTVNYVPWKTLYYGCASCGSFTWYKSCETSSCSGPVDYSVGRGDKKQCGGCDY